MKKGKCEDYRLNSQVQLKKDGFEMDKFNKNTAKSLVVPFFEP